MEQGTTRVTSLGQYQRLAIRTMRDDGATRKIVHCVMGMMGEAGEVNDSTSATLMGELGDCMWYLANLCHVTGLAFRVEAQPIAPELIKEEVVKSRLMATASVMIDMVKKTEFYGKPVDMDLLTEHVGYYSAYLGDLIYRNQFTLEQVMTANILKLEARYKSNKFNADHAINRDYSEESKAAGCEVK